MQRNRRKGTAVIEVSLMMPWIAFLFVGILDLGYYSYAAISTQNAARAAALRASFSQYHFSSGPNSSSCLAAIAELRGLPNMVTVNTCQASPATVTDAAPVALVMDQLCASGCTDVCADCAVSPAATSVRAQVTYRSIPMIPIPGVLMGTYQLTRTAESRVLIK